MGLAAPPPPSLALALAAALVVAPTAGAAEPSAAALADIRRAFAVVGPSDSVEPALRQERLMHEPSAAFVAGAALAAWINAAAQLAFDLQNPAAAGPPHVSQGAPNTDAIADDCMAEKAAFDRLAAGARALGLAPAQVVAAAGAKDSAAAAWQARESAPLQACR